MGLWARVSAWLGNQSEPGRGANAMEPARCPDHHHGAAAKVHRVLLKTPFGIEESFWELTPDRISKFVDKETCTAYGMCVYEDGRPKYTLLVKHLWDKIP